MNGVPIDSADELMYQISVAGKKIVFMVKKTPEEDLKKLSIAQTPSLRKQINQKNAGSEQNVLCYMKALFSYDPKEDSLHPCPEIGLMFFQGDILAIVNQVKRLLWSVPDPHIFKTRFSVLAVYQVDSN